MKHALVVIPAALTASIDSLPAIGPRRNRRRRPFRYARISGRDM